MGELRNKVFEPLYGKKIKEVATLLSSKKEEIEPIKEVISSPTVIIQDKKGLGLLEDNTTKILLGLFLILLIVVVVAMYYRQKQQQSKVTALSKQLKKMRKR